MDTKTVLDDPTQAGPIIGLIAAFNILIEHLHAKGRIDAAATARLLEDKIEELKQDPTTMNIDAAVVLDMIRNPLVSAERQATRRLANEPPAGRG